MKIHYLIKEREIKIASIEQSLKENPEQDLKKLVFECCNVLQISEKKAKEYIDIAKWRIENVSKI